MVSEDADPGSIERRESTRRSLLGLPLRAASALADTAEHIPVAGSAVHAARRTAHDVVGTAGAMAVAGTQSGLGALVREVVDAFTSEVDLTALVVDNVDIDAIVATVDLDAIVARLDLDAIVASVDLDAIIARVDLDAAVARVDLDAIIDRIDVDRVLDKVDLDAVVARVDLDGAIERVDVDAVINRVDLIGLADVVIDGVDLPGIIREASTSVTADVMTDVRSSSERADDAVADLVGRILRRRARRGRDGTPPTEPDSAEPDSAEPDSTGPAGPIVTDVTLVTEIDEDPGRD